MVTDITTNWICPLDVLPGSLSFQAGSKITMTTIINSEELCFFFFFFDERWDNLFFYVSLVLLWRVLYHCGDNKELITVIVVSLDLGYLEVIQCLGHNRRDRWQGGASLSSLNSTNKTHLNILPWYSLFPSHFLCCFQRNITESIITIEARNSQAPF